MDYEPRHSIIMLVQFEKSCMSNYSNDLGFLKTTLASRKVRSNGNITVISGDSASLLFPHLHGQL